LGCPGPDHQKDRIVKKTRDIIANHEGPISRVPEEAKKDIQKILDEAEERVRSK
jgi:hypothetical protein